MTFGSERASDLRHVDILSTGIGAAECSERRGVFADEGDAKR
jgi:hypothetical protein